jgi:hypothetical protein
LSQGAAPPSLLVRLTKLSDDRLRFEYRRPDGTGEAFDLQADSFLFHDLLHFAVETEANLQVSFYGLLAKVGGYAELSVAGGAALGGEIAVTERVVGALTDALKTEDLDADAFAEQAIGFLDAYDERAPRWFTAALVLRVRERMRQLEGRWRATPFDETMELSFPLAR